MQGKFPREAELKAKRKELADLEKDLLENPVPPPQWLVDGAPMQADVMADGKKGEVASYRATEDDNYYVGVQHEGSDAIKFYPWQEVMLNIIYYTATSQYTTCHYLQLNLTLPNPCPVSRPTPANSEYLPSIKNTFRHSSSKPSRE